MDAYIVINCEQNTENHVYEKVLEYEEVIGVHLLFGEWDVLVKVRVENSEELSTFVIDAIRKIEGVKLTQTYIVAR